MNIKKKNIKKIISTILLSFFVFSIFSINFIFAESDNNSLCWGKYWQDRYNCEIKNYCEIYKKQSKNLNFKWEDYFEKSKSWEEILLENAKKKYRKNQNSIYACNIIKLQQNSFKLVKKLLKWDKTWIVTSKINQKIELRIEKLKTIAREKKCISPNNKEEGNSIINKQQLLNESAYEYCKYNFYLDYLKNHYKNVENSNKEFLWKTKQKSYKIWQIANLQNKIQQDIIEEENHSAKVFDMAFATYIDYENNHPVHILLELIKEDFIVLRQKLYEAISPINQVVYKISNAMSIH